MIHLQVPEFLWLALPLVYAGYRWGGFRVDWWWLVPVAAWAASTYFVEWPWWSHLWVVIPVGLSLRGWLRQAGVTGALRLSVLALLLLALTGPEWNVGGEGVDVVIVADRSRSMPAGSGDNVRELIANLERNRGGEHRTALVTFGARSAVEYALSRDQLLQEYTRDVADDGSDLNDALEQALDLVDPDRPARILVLSDGEANGAPPTQAARRAREDGVPIDVRVFERPRVGDVAIRSIQLPEEVAPREPFQFSVEVFADADVVGDVSVIRGGEVIARRTGALYAGTNRLTFRDIIERGGIHDYAVRLDVGGDPQPENNIGAGLVRVGVPPRILVLNSDGQSGNLVTALKAARLPVDVAAASDFPLSLDTLDPYRAVIIENAPASDFGRVKMELLAEYVEHLAGGLLLTGGRRSFGVGGYYNSPLEDVLPVSMELRDEHRKTRVAIAIALDRSGSMAVNVRGGKTKMDLANLGTAECIRLLSAGDSVAVIAVDSTPHTIQPLTEITSAEQINRRVLQIESMGGGIFVYEALVAAGNELAHAEQATKHIILFSDAADSEEPGAYRNLLSSYESAGITVSVIGLGSERDTDARLLEEIATLGRGNIMFTDDPEELPRLFTEDTMSVARSSFIEKDPETQPVGIPGALQRDAQLMGGLLAVGGSSAGFPAADGYNLSYLRPDATAAVISQDEYVAPWSAFWNYGLGKAAAITLEVDGQFSGAFGRWENYDDFLITHARWLLGDDDPEAVFVDLDRQGQDAVITVELDPERADRGSGRMPKLVVVPPDATESEPLEPDLAWTGPDTLEGRFPLRRSGSYRTLIVADGAAGGDASITRGPVVTLPYSPEYDPREGLPSGSEVLLEVAELSGGIARTDVLGVFADPPRSARANSMLPWLLSIVLVLLILEIAGRRLSLWESLRGALESVPLPRTVPRPGWSLRLPTPQRRRTKSAEQPVAATPQTPAEPAPPPPAPTDDKKKSADVFSAAKQRARRRTK